MTEEEVQAEWNRMENYIKSSGSCNRISSIGVVKDISGDLKMQQEDGVTFTAKIRLEEEEEIELNFCNPLRSRTPNYNYW